MVMTSDWAAIAAAMDEIANNPNDPRQDEAAAWLHHEYCAEPEDLYTAAEWILGDAMPV